MFWYVTKVGNLFQRTFLKKYFFHQNYSFEENNRVANRNIHHNTCILLICNCRLARQVYPHQLLVINLLVCNPIRAAKITSGPYIFYLISTCLYIWHIHYICVILNVYVWDTSRPFMEICCTEIIDNDATLMMACS